MIRKVKFFLIFPAIAAVFWIIAFSQVEPKSGEEWVNSVAIASYADNICILQLNYIEDIGAQVQRAFLLFSTDNGERWKRIEIPTQTRPITINYDCNGSLWLWFDAGILWKSKPPFTSWFKESGSYLPSSNISQIVFLPDNKIICYAMTGDSFQYKWFISEDGGKVWTKLFNEHSSDSSSLTYSTDYIYQNVKGKAFFLKLRYKEKCGELEISNDEGKTWKHKGFLRWEKMLIPDSGYERKIIKILDDSILFAGTSLETKTTANFSVDRGQTWNISNLNPEIYKDDPFLTDAIVLGRSRALIIMSNQIVSTKDAGRTWKCVWGPKKGCWLEKCYLSPKGEIWVIGNIILRSKDGIRFKEVRID